MAFSDPIAGTEVLIRNALQSRNYVANTSGWRIESDGSAEFNQVTAYGAGITVGDNVGSQVIIRTDADEGIVEFPVNTAEEAVPASIRSDVVTLGASYYASLDIQSPGLASPDDGIGLISLESESEDGTRMARINFWIGVAAALNVVSISEADGLQARNFQRGTTTHVFSAETFKDVVVTFPVAFNGVPKVSTTIALTGTLPAGSSALVTRVFSKSATGMTIRVSDVNAVARTLTITVDWLAEYG
jgi:hypothetical protein